MGGKQWLVAGGWGSGSAYWRIGVWGSMTAFRHRHNDQEVSTELMMLCKRRHADTPTRRSPSRPPDLLKTLTAYATLELDPASAGITKSTRN